MLIANATPTIANNVEVATIANKRGFYALKINSYSTQLQSVVFWQVIHKPVCIAQFLR